MYFYIFYQIFFINLNAFNIKSTYKYIFRQEKWEILTLILVKDFAVGYRSSTVVHIILNTFLINSMLLLFVCFVF